MSGSQSFFALFDLPEGFDVDTTELTERYRTLQRAVHPDRFASAPSHERLAAVQRAAEINDAYNTLKTPLGRAKYLLSLKGMALDDEKGTLVDPAFLMEQMEMREELQAAREAGDADAVGQLLDRIGGASRDARDELSELFRRGDREALEGAARAVQKLQFLQRLGEEAEALESDLD